MSNDEVIAKKGAVLALTSDEYEDYSVDCIGVAMQDITNKTLRELAEKSELFTKAECALEDNEYYRAMATYKFTETAIAEGVIKKLDVTYIQYCNYGEFVI